MEILQHRESRKDAGMVGCITGKPTPEMDFFGYRDVQSWRPADPMNPHCFCFDCRGLWDSDAAIDAELVNSGHWWACDVYASLLGLATTSATATTTPSETSATATAAAAATATAAETTESVGWSNVSPPQVEEGEEPLPRLMQRTNGGGIGVM
jgi:hypothetical protein